ncbi:MAG: glycosyl hydrolase family 28 protein, partial [Rectinema sp.]|nr:glycosyl hydrolase family 28 protein [Rectinema sp.]
IGTDRGIRIKSRRGRGGTVQNLDFRNLLMDKVLVPLTINLYYHCGAPRGDRAQLFSLEIAPMSPLTPRLRNIKISNIVADRCRASTGFIAGLPESKIENLVIENYIASLSNDDLAEISTSEMYEGLPEIQARGIRIRNAKCVLSGVHIGGVKDQEAIIKESGSTVIDLDKKEQS